MSQDTTKRTERMRVPQLVNKKCSVCGKVFGCYADSYVYRCTRNTNRLHWYCSWKCLRSDDRKYEALAEEKARKKRDGTLTRKGAVLRMYEQGNDAKTIATLMHLKLDKVKAIIEKEELKNVQAEA